ncbi:MAG: hypothetical protein HYY39_00885 [Armatimonadetes bacterium]|nr:hypothetical protein [Armatimonadota bacterium]MBI2972334.1 hypothetical protein [Armatimonadota bacterium]
MLYIGLRRRREGFELVDVEGKYLGIALTLAQARRLAAACGASLVFEDETNATELRD